MLNFTMTINGQGVTSERNFSVNNPATEEVFAECPSCSKAQLDMAMEAAKSASFGWETDEAKRRKVLFECSTAIKARTNELADLLTREQGKTIGESLMEVNIAINRFADIKNLKLPYELIQDNDLGRVEVLYRPIGVIGIISPWNAPLILGFGKAVLALLAGNTVVLKPSSLSPLTTLKIGEILRDVLPAGVFNIVSGGSEVGTWMTEHPVVRKIAFTGSVEVGKRVARTASFDLKRILLELGGNDPAIVLNDVDPKKVALELSKGVFLFTGQVCMAIKRIYAQEEVFEPLVHELTEIAKNIRIGNGLDPLVDMGPLNNLAQLEWVTEIVEDAKKAGARIHTGGKRPDGPGYFYPPTIITGISEGTRLVDEEQFGPVIPIMRFSKIEDAIERANNSKLGLGGSVWTNDIKKGAEIASKLECGTGWVNHHMFAPVTAPFGGWKWSGIGRHLGKWGLESFTEMQTISIAKVDW